MHKPFFLSLLLVVACGSDSESADTLFVNGRIVSLTDGAVEVEALAVRDGRIIAIGDEQELATFEGDSTETVDLGGRCVVPGFIDAHAHFLAIGSQATILDLKSIANWDEAVRMVEAAAGETQAGRPIVGRGWHQDKWDRVPDDAVDGVPRHASLSAVSPDHPVVLTHASGHASFLNAKALAMSGIDRETENPPGGEIVRDEHDEPTGLLRETAMDLSIRATSGAKRVDRRRLAELASEELLRKGVTSLHDAGVSLDDYEFFEGLAADDELDVRLWVMTHSEAGAIDAWMSKRGQRAPLVASEFLTLGGIKRSLDGALGSHGAWLLEPYEDLGSSTGLNLITLEVLADTADVAATHGLQLCVHAIGDRANRETLDVFKRKRAEHGLDDARWRIEHAQHLDPEDIPRFAQEGVLASIQTVHCISDGPWVPDRIGAERAREGAYRWRELLDSGAKLANGTDAPVEDVDPLANFRAAVTRRMKNGEVFHGDQKLTRLEALEATTKHAAYLARQEAALGTLEPGKLADFVVLSGHLLEVDDAELADVVVEATYVGGVRRYTR